MKYEVKNDVNSFGLNNDLWDISLVIQTLLLICMKIWEPVSEAHNALLLHELAVLEWSGVGKRFAYVSL